MPEFDALRHLQKEEPAPTEDRRDVKVKLPAAQVLRLYYLKLTTSLNYSDVVEEALDRYFAEVDHQVEDVPGFQRMLGSLE